MEKNVRSFLVLIEKKIGMKPIIYTSEEYWHRFLSESDWGCEYHLWLDKPGVVLPQQIYPWSGWTFWQQSYQERIPGVQNDCGINWFNGSIKELKELATQI
jgi:lysozyme